MEENNEDGMDISGEDKNNNNAIQVDLVNEVEDEMENEENKPKVLGNLFFFQFKFI